MVLGLLDHCYHCLHALIQVFRKADNGLAGQGLRIKESMSLPLNV